jgi:hypothetical protein
MFWSRETAYVSRIAGQPTVETNWILLQNNGDGEILTANDVRDIDRPPAESLGVALSSVKFGHTWPDDFRDTYGEGEQVGLLLKRCAFLASPYIGKEGVRASHHHRRQMEKAGIPAAEANAYVHVVTLRREVAPSTKPSEPTDVEWQHQWWVSRHYRAQWYPGEHAHKVIWIAPYLKGPSGKPILEKIYSVVR